MTVDANSEHWDIPVEELEWRIQHAKEGSDQALYVPYPNARTVAKHLDLVFGWDGWSDSYQVVETNKIKEVGIICTIEIATEAGQRTIKTGFGTVTDIEAWKGGESDSFKRAAAKLGIGRNVYDLEMVWARCERGGNGKAYKPRGIEPELIKKALGKQSSAEPRGTKKVAPKPEPKPEVGFAVPDEQWQRYIDFMSAFSMDQKKIIAEWWSAHGDGRKKPERDIERKPFIRLLERVQVEALGGTEIAKSAEDIGPDEAPW